MPLETWMDSPFELIKHADEHQQILKDFDKRIALIGYDNAIEVSINTYLQLHPSQRGGATYQNDDVNKWLANYYSMLDFFFDIFLKNTDIKPLFSKQNVIHYHKLRNDLYHEGKNFVPSERDIQGIRTAAIYIFSTLFSVDGDKLLKNSPTLHNYPTKKYFFQGSGDDLQKMYLRAEVTIFRIKYNGSYYPTVYLRDENEGLFARILTPSFYYTPQETVVTIIENRSKRLKREGYYLLEVKVKTGNWEIEVEQ